MTISLIDVAEETGNSQDVIAQLSSAVKLNPEPVADNKQRETTAQSPVPDEVLPTKLRGKSLEEIAQMYVNLESAHGRMANDLGQQRALTDRLLDLKRETDLAANGGTSRQPSKISRDDILGDNPNDALERFVEERVQARTTETAQRLAQLEGSLAQQNFMSKHSDYSAIGASPDFQNWLYATPYRAKVAQQAARGDWSAADELFTEYKSRTGSVASNRQQAADAGLSEARKAGLESGSSPDKASGKATEQKTYRRQDLIRLRVERPDDYYSEDFQREITRAYAQGRVR